MKKLGFGLMRLPLTDSNDYTSVDVEMVKQMAHTFLRGGFTYFDTAATYHQGYSEIAFREAVAERYPRSSYTITDKLSLFLLKGEADFQPFFDAQLARLGVEYVDYYLIHSLGGSSYQLAEKWNAFAFLQKLKAEGRAKHIGISYHDKAELLDEILTKHSEVEYIQLQLNYLDWEDPIVESRKCYEVAVKHRKPVIVMEPIKGGSLVNIPEEAIKRYHEYAPKMSVASWAIRFAASLANVVMVLSGMSSQEQMEDNTTYMGEFCPMNEEELSLVEQTATIIKASISIPCTSCRYCVDDCPMKIAIPDYFAIYNNLKRFATTQEFQKIVAKTYYGNLIQTHGKASACVRCGKCEEHCPQHLQIRKYLAQVADELER